MRFILRTDPNGTRSCRLSVRHSAVAVAVAAALGGPPSSAESVRIDPKTGAATHEFQANGVTVSLTRLLPDQVRAFYVARGFDLDDADVFARACVYITVLRNDTAPGTLDFRLSDWFDARGLTVLAVDVGEDMDTVFAFTGQLDPAPTFPLLLDTDSRAAQDWGVKGLPTSFVIDPEGRVIIRAVGGTEFDDAAAVEQLVRYLPKP